MYDYTKVSLKRAWAFGIFGATSANWRPSCGSYEHDLEWREKPSAVIKPDASMAQCVDMVPRHAKVVTEEGLSVTEHRACGSKTQGQVFVSECGVSKPHTRLEKCGKEEEEMQSQCRASIDDRAAADMNMMENARCRALATGREIAESNMSLAVSEELMPDHGVDFKVDKCDSADTNMADGGDMVSGHTIAEHDVSVAALEPGQISELRGDDLNKRMTEYGEMVPGRGHASEVKMTSLMRRLADPFLVNEVTLAAAEASLRQGMHYEADFKI